MKLGQGLRLFRYKLFPCDWRAAVNEMMGEKFTVVFIDPPYKKVEEYTAVVNELKARGLLANGAWLVLEHETKTKLEGFPDGFELAKPHKYGDTAITVLKYTAGTGE